MKFGVVIFPGSNCDHDMIYTLETIMGHEVERLWHKDSNLPDIDAIALPGGFTYGDYLRPGALARYSPIMQEVIRFANSGRPVFGICNGFQILCEAGLLSGVLLPNLSRKFICKNQYILPDNPKTAFTSKVGTKPLNIPIAHGEGRFYADDNTLNEIEENGQVLFRYCDEKGRISDDSNPNGSVNFIAGICNKQKNVYGMMPHPERAADAELGNTDGFNILESFVRWFE
ncbi:MAG TPA: phosphoribosylformylglycinamidine synthase subunit PurQ [Salinivirgaceae bacterium]|nr:phosphoribosylformylglycinamidine synthase subunit PurQ [Salinivirgaceae bacterium]